MLAYFRCHLPGRAPLTLPPGLEFVLAGDSAEGLAWDLVELFFDAVTMHESWLWCDPERLRPAQDRTRQTSVVSH